MVERNTRWHNLLTGASTRPSDLVARRADLLDRPALRVGEVPAEVADAGHVGALVAASSATERPSTRCASTRYRAFAIGELPSLGVSYVSTQVSPIY